MDGVGAQNFFCSENLHITKWYVSYIKVASQNLSFLLEGLVRDIRADSIRISKKNRECFRLYHFFDKKFVSTFVLRSSLTLSFIYLWVFIVFVYFASNMILIFIEFVKILWTFLDLFENLILFALFTPIYRFDHCFTMAFHIAFEIGSNLRINFMRPNVNHALETNLMFCYLCRFHWKLLFHSRNLFEQFTSWGAQNFSPSFFAWQDFLPTSNNMSLLESEHFDMLDAKQQFLTQPCCCPKFVLHKISS